MEELTYRREFEPYYKRILLLWGAFIVCLLFTTIITAWIGGTVGNRTVLIYVSSAMQNICVFILPALLTAYYITPQPAALLGLDRKPGWGQVLVVVGTLVLSMPAMNYLVHLNESIDLPDSALEQWFRSTEAAARAVTDELLASQSVWQLMVSVLVVGVLTGFGEELFFRGAQQRIFLLRGVNGHVAVWVTAVIFSALHFQFYGFFPRLLLGAFFGYLAWKGRSIWLPVVAHALNNSLAVVFGYMAANYPAFADIDSYGVPANGEFPVAAFVSMVATVVFLVLCWKKIVTR